MENVVSTLLHGLGLLGGHGWNRDGKRGEL